MEEVTQLIEFFLQFKDQPVSWPAFIFASILALCILSIVEVIRVKGKKGKIFSPVFFLCGCLIAEVVIFVLIWLFGQGSLVLAVVLSVILSYYIQDKYFKFLQDSSTEDDVSHRQELQNLQKKFKKSPHFSILEVLLFYGYISPLQKDYVEIENIFETPDEMATKLLSLPALSEKQLREAKAIMNVIRREGKILTKQDALLLVSKIEERRDKDEENSDNSNK